MSEPVKSWPKDVNGEIFTCECGREYHSSVFAINWTRSDNIERQFSKMRDRLNFLIDRWMASD